MTQYAVAIRLPNGRIKLVSNETIIDKLTAERKVAMSNQQASTKAFLVTLTYDAS